MNDLYLPDSSPFNVSRNHFSIERTADGYVLRDRGSCLGTIVNGELVGGNRTSAVAKLVFGENEIIIDVAHSLFRFKVIVDGPT